MSKLTFVCVTKGELYAGLYLRWMAYAAKVIGAEFLLAVDGNQFPEWNSSKPAKIVIVRSAGYIESVLDEVMQEVETEYVLRLDDDERISESMMEWLRTEEYTQSEIWSFPRCNMISRTHFINQSPLFPDLQTRLTTKEKALGWVSDTIHHGCPYGSGRHAPHAIIHDKFVVKSYQERREIADRYEAIREGGGYSEMFKPFQLPEDVYKSGAYIWPVGNGSFPDWQTLPGKGELWHAQH